VWGVGQYLLRAKETVVDLITLLPQWLVTGITLGSIYALIALGFVTIYNVTGVINLAQGEFVMIGALAIATLSRAAPLPLAAALAILLTAIVGAAIYQVTLRPARGASIVTLIIITIGVSIVLRGIALLIWGVDPYPLRAFSPGPPISLGVAVITRQALWVIATTGLAVLLLYLFFTKTMLGRGMRACALNARAARLMGVPLARMSMLAFALSAGVAAIGGIVLTPIQYASYDIGLILGLKGFVAAIMGGLSSLPGAIIGGLLLGMLESIGGGINSAYKEAVAFVILIAVLIARRLVRAPGADLSRGGL
jgi:branched-chain amino acid transport system permease protein